MRQFLFVSALLIVAIGLIPACDNSSSSDPPAQFITFTRNDTLVECTEDPEFYNETLQPGLLTFGAVYTYDANNAEGISISIPADAQSGRSYGPTEARVATLYVRDSRLTFAYAGDNYPGSDLEINVESMEEIGAGNYITGTFSATVLEGSGNTLTMTDGRFRMELKEVELGTTKAGL
jgi:hypothetical protein